LVSKDCSLRRKHTGSKGAEAFGAVRRVIGDNEDGVDIAEPCPVTSRLTPKEDEVDKSRERKRRAQGRSKSALLLRPPHPLSHNEFFATLARTEASVHREGRFCSLRPKPPT